MFMKSFAEKYLVLLLLFLMACSVPVTKKQIVKADKEQFVMVNGKHFEIGSKPYYFVGANLWYGANLGALIEIGNQQRLLDELDLLSSLGVNNLRILGASEGSIYTNTVNPAIQPKMGQYNKNLLKGLDFLLSEMNKRDMYAVIYLNNFWIWSGGMARYVTWAEEKPLPNPWFDDYGWGNFMNLSASMYSNPKANDAYKKYIELLINRENTYTGIIYKNDPTIMSWQLANEPRPGAGEERNKNSEVFSQWIKQTALYIKSLDSNHLVSIGSEGIVGTMGSAELYEEVHKYTDVDYLTFHLWVYNWNWFDPLKPQETYPIAENKALDYIEKHIELAEQIGKPIVFEEFGIPRDKHSYTRESTTLWRDRYFDFVYDQIYQNANQGGLYRKSTNC